MKAQDIIQQASKADSKCRKKRRWKSRRKKENLKKNGRNANKGIKTIWVCEAVLRTQAVGNARCNGKSKRPISSRLARSNANKHIRNFGHGPVKIYHEKPDGSLKL